MLRLTVLTGTALLVVAMAARAHTPSQPPHQLFNEGDLKLESGEVIKDFSISYVTHGTLNANKSNAILMVTAISGNHHRLDFMIGPGKALDTNKYFIIDTDAIANGLTTSPSNSTAQPRMQFPKFLIRDMVTSQHLRLTEHLGINHVVQWSAVHSQNIIHPRNCVVGASSDSLKFMTAWGLQWLSGARQRLRQRRDLLLEFIVLHHQLAVLQRTGTRRPCFRTSERCFGCSCRDGGPIGNAI